jgi:late competence protein required for DNA uptake (superfamily II DNA/RNA helicase)
MTKKKQHVVQSPFGPIPIIKLSHAYTAKQIQAALKKKLYHCAKCGRLSTALSSYKCVEAQLYCVGCVPQSESDYNGKTN